MLGQAPADFSSSPLVLGTSWPGSRLAAFCEIKSICQLDTEQHRLSALGCEAEALYLLPRGFPKASGSIARASSGSENHFHIHPSLVGAEEEAEARALPGRHWNAPSGSRGARIWKQNGGCFHGVVQKPDVWDLAGTLQVSLSLIKAPFANREEMDIWMLPVRKALKYPLLWGPIFWRDSFQLHHKNDMEPCYLKKIPLNSEW